MATLNEKLQLAVNIKEDIKSVLEDKGIDMTNKKFADYPDIIADLYYLDPADAPV